MLKKLARTCFRTRWPVLIGWIVLLVGLMTLSQVARGTFKTEFDALSGTESKVAFDIFEEGGFVERTGQQAQIVFTADQGVDNPEVEAAMSEFLSDIEASLDRANASSPYAPGGERQLSDAAGELVGESGEEIDVPGLRAEYGGDVFFEAPGAP